MEQNQAKFEGWAVVEMMGHQKEIGYVTTEYFGGAALLRIDVPEIADHEYITTRPEYDRRMREIPIGTKVKRPGLRPRSRLVSPAALYALNPCSEEFARKALDDMSPRPLLILEMPTTETPALEAGEVEGERDDRTICPACLDGDHEYCIDVVAGEDGECECDCDCDLATRDLDSSCGP